MSALVIHGDATALPLAAASVDAIVCDPPYGLEFMGKDWDRPWAVGTSSPGYGDAERLARPSFGDSRNANCRTCGGRQRGARRCACDSPAWDRDPAEDMRAFGRWSAEWAAEAFRVLKPGGYLLAFGGSRTWHRLACAIEDAGFELRDSIAWMYGSGFPKSLDVSKAIDKDAGVCRERVPLIRGALNSGTANGWGSDPHSPTAPLAGTRQVNTPATDAARQWQGWGTALKPAFEPIVVARKPLIGTVAQNVTMHGTGALNIGACRVAHGADVDLNHQQRQTAASAGMSALGESGFRADHEQATYNPAGRWPSNVVLSHADTCLEGGCEPGCPVAELDEQSGTLKSGKMLPTHTTAGVDGRGTFGADAAGGFTTMETYGDSGGASRFFPTFRYQAKAPSRERPVGPDGTKHPTCKPVDLMRWLVRLVTPPGGLVLDPFAGSGTTLEAAQLEGFRAIGVEKHAPYLPLIEQRIERSNPVDEDDWTLFGGAA